jgi:YHS domain-containing protein
VRNVLIWAMVGAAAFAACGKGAARPVGDRPTEAEASRLEAADAADGVKDHVVAKCAVCGLGMDGKPEHASRYAGYELHFCSDECKETFDHDPHAVIRRLPTRAR